MAKLSKSKSSNKFILNIIIRYALALLIAFPNLYLFYWLFTPATINLSSLFLSPFYSVTTIGNTLIINSLSIELIKACIAGAAYYLLVVINLLTPMPLKTRAKSLVFLILTFLIINAIRIAIFSALALNNYAYFDLAHKLVWTIGSTLFVIILWFSSTIIFKIDKIPIYSDIRRIINAINN